MSNLIPSIGLSLFGALSWPHLLALAGPAAAYATKAAIDTVVAKHGAARECAISCVLNLDKHQSSSASLVPIENDLSAQFFEKHLSSNGSSD